MPNQQNEEIRAIQNTIALLRKGIPLQESQSKREEMKHNVKELESILIKKLNGTSDFEDVKIGEDVY